MAKKKQDQPVKYPQNRSTTPTTFRLTPECHALMERLATTHELSKTAVIEVGMRLLDHALSRPLQSKARALIDAAKKNPD